PKAKEWRMFKAGEELSFVLERFPLDALTKFAKNIDVSSENLAAYIVELRELSRVGEVLTFLSKAIRRNDYVSMYDALCQHFETRSFLGKARKRLVLLEVAMATICSASPDFSYDKLAKASGDPDLVANPNQFRRYPKLQGNPRARQFQAASKALWRR